MHSSTIVIGLAIACGTLFGWSGGSAHAAQGGPLTPANLPVVLDGAVEALAVSGDRVFVGGTFTSLRLPDGSTISRPYLFSYSLTTGDLDTGFLPVLDGDVATLAAASDGTAIYAGGSFSKVGPAFRLRVAKIGLDGTADPTFVANADKRLTSLALRGQTLVIGGQFTQVNGVARSLVAAVDAGTGAVDPGFVLPITESAAPGGFTSVMKLAVSPDGNTLLIAHNGLRVAGQSRAGLALADLSTATATLLPWRTTLWSDNLADNGGLIRITDAAFGPDGSWFAVTNTGGDRVPTNDAVQRFDLAAALPATPTWVTRQFDSAYSVAVGGNGAIYTGGHFRYTEAPGSIEPYPGLITGNYGFGPTGGARVLGEQVVGRQQVDALDPATGKALNWAGSANGQHGVTALLVDGDRLLLGHDGNRVGGLATGAHGILQAYGATLDPALPHSVLDQPLAGAILPPGRQHLTGSATAPAGVHSLVVEVLRPGQSGFLNPDGSWGGYYAFPAALDAVDSATVTWSVDVELADTGDYLLRTKAADVDRVAEVVAPTPVEVYDVQAVPPAVTITNPIAAQQDFTSRTITVSGTAADADGVAAVSISAYNVTATSYLSGPNTLGDFTTFAATLNSPGSTGVTWTTTLTLPNGSWSIYANAVDRKGIALPEPVRVLIVMAPGNPAPALTITSPAATAISSTSSVTVRGTATDLDGVARVLVMVRDTRHGLGPSIGVDWGLAGWLPASLSAAGGRSVTWSLTVPLPLNTYSVNVYAQDQNGLITPAAGRPALILRRWPVGVTAEPTTKITSPLPNVRAGTLTLPVTGSASSVKGVAAVRVTLWDSRGLGYLQPNGTLDRLPAPLATTLTAPNAASTGFSASLRLPYASTWTVNAYAIDRLGTIDASPTDSRLAVKIYPGDADPTLTMVSPANGAVIATGRRITMGGRAFDDHGVSAVQVVLRRSDGVGLQADGRLGVAAWLPGFVTNPGGPATSWQFSSPVLTAGVWRVYSRAIDSVGKEQLTYPTATVTLR